MIRLLPSLLFFELFLSSSLLNSPPVGICGGILLYPSASFGSLLFLYKIS